ncbi:hypothetical protein B4080_6269 [Bacillus cereus]|nr:hypothetical protein B4080_6269 [Bacillus cereus]
MQYIILKLIELPPLSLRLEVKVGEVQSEFSVNFSLSKVNKRIEYTVEDVQSY